jgi:hypothetical protein
MFAGESAFTGDRFLLSIDNTIVVTNIGSPAVALGMGFAAYFIFGIIILSP